MPELYTPPALKLPQARVLAVLVPDVGDDPPLGTVPRAALAEAAGFIPTSGTMSKVLNGIQNPESSTGKQQDGLLQYGYIERVTIDLDGMTTDAYRITRSGIRAIRLWLASNELPAKRDEALCTNRK